MAFAYGTLITIPNGTTPIEQLSLGDTALAWTPDGAVPKAVVFSDGTPGGYLAESFFFLRFGEGTLILTQDQPIVLAGNKVKRAVQLRPGDQLLMANGQSVMLDMLSLGQWSSGIHSVSIDNFEQTGDHFIIANGIVCGDYLMQIMPPDDSDDMPFLGDEEHKTTE